jgi:hypothetical protein
LLTIVDFPAPGIPVMQTIVFTIMMILEWISMKVYQNNYTIVKEIKFS